MADFNVRSDAVNVEQIMEQIRARIREKRGVDYTEAQVRELAGVKLEKFLDPRGIRSDLLEQYRKAQPPYAPPELPNFSFEADTLFTSTRGPLRFIRRLLLPILKLFFNPNPLIQALNIQSRLNASAAEREAKRDAQRYAFDQLHYEVMHNLVLETTKLGIEVKNLKMRVESLASRLEFNERRARALESVVVYKPSGEETRRDDTRRDDTRREEPRRDEPRRQDSRRDERRQESRRPEPRPAPPVEASPTPEPAAAPIESPAESIAEPSADVAALPEGPGQRSRRRRRRRGRRGSGAAGLAPTGDALASQAEETQASGADADAAGDVDVVDTEDAADESSAPEAHASAPSDVRLSRPELLEHAFGAQAHPTEPAVGDPVQAMRSTPPPVTETSPAESDRLPETHDSASSNTPAPSSTNGDPSTAPEQ